MGVYLTQYEAFLEALEGPFEEFVKSDEVNKYLLTLGDLVESEVTKDGVAYKFLIVSGYEKERGNWGTSYNNQIRFGGKEIPVEGLEEPMVITPNFFYGRNGKGEEVEYRMGLIKNEEGISLYPVILKNREKSIQAVILGDLCVRHVGLFIDSQTAEQLGTPKVEQLTAYQQFLTTFWNIDDYVRKQNPQFQSDYDISVWDAVEAFSGRIVDQMLRNIHQEFIEKIEPFRERNFNIGSGFINFFAPKYGDFESWVIPVAEESYEQMILSGIRSCLESRDIVATNKLFYLLSNLLSYITNFNKPGLLREFQTPDLQVLPYLETTITRCIEHEEYPRDEEFYLLESELVYEAIGGVLAGYWDGLPSYFREFDVKMLVPLFLGANRVLRETAMQFYLALNQLEGEGFYDEQSFKKKLKMDLLPGIHTYLKEFGASRIVFILTDDERHQTKKVREVGLSAFQLIIEQDPSLFSEDDWNFFYRTLPLDAFQLLLNLKPHLVSSKEIEKLVYLLSSRKKKVVEAALDAYKTALKQTPQFIEQDHIIRISEFIEFHKAFEIYDIVLKKFPQFIEKTLPIVYEEWDYEVLPEELIHHVQDIYKLVITHDPKIIERVYPTILQWLSDKTRNKRGWAVIGFHVILDMLPALINKEDFQKIIGLIEDPNYEIQYQACLTIKTAISSKSTLINQETTIRIVSKMVDRNIFPEICRIYGLMLEKTPKFVPDTLPLVFKYIEQLPEADPSKNYNSIAVSFELALRKWFIYTPEFIDKIWIDKLLGYQQHSNLTVRDLARNLVDGFTRTINRYLMKGLCPLCSQEYVSKPNERQIVCTRCGYTKIREMKRLATLFIASQNKR